MMQDTTGATAPSRPTRRQRDQARAYHNGYDAGAKHGDAATCCYRKPWLRAGWRAGYVVAMQRRGRS